MKNTNNLVSLIAAVGVVSFGLGAFAAPITADRLLNADDEPQNWLMTNQTYGGARYSKLNMINKENVANLKIVYMAAIGGGETSNAPGSPVLKRPFRLWRTGLFMPLTLITRL